MGFVDPQPKCERCRWPHGGFHICLDSSPEELKKVRPANPRKGMKLGPASMEARSNMSTAQQERWEAANADRNKRIIELYKEGGRGFKDVARIVGVAPSTALKALKEAEALGLVKMNKRGVRLDRKAANG